MFLTLLHVLILLSLDYFNICFHTSLKVYPLSLDTVKWHAKISPFPLLVRIHYLSVCVTHPDVLWTQSSLSLPSWSYKILLVFLTELSHSLPFYNNGIVPVIYQQYSSDTATQHPSETISSLYFYLTPQSVSLLHFLSVKGVTFPASVTLCLILGTSLGSEGLRALPSALLDGAQWLAYPFSCPLIQPYLPKL